MRLTMLFVVLVLALPRAVKSQTPPGGDASVRGVVFDSLAMRPLAEATVQLVDATGNSWAKSYTTDSTGTFEFTGVPLGTYLVGFFHTKLDSLGLSSQTLRVGVGQARPVQVRLAIPSGRAIAQALCGRSKGTDSTGLFLGYLRGADNSMPRPNGIVVMRWAEIVIEKKSISRNVPTIEVSSGPTGLAAVCGHSTPSR